MRAQHSNSRSCEWRGVLELVPSWRSLVEALARKEPYPYHILGIKGLECKKSQGSSTHQIMKSRVAKGTCA
jgi:hypothetical protein